MTMVWTSEWSEELTPTQGGAQKAEARESPSKREGRNQTIFCRILPPFFDTQGEPDCTRLVLEQGRPEHVCNSGWMNFPEVHRHASTLSTSSPPPCCRCQDHQPLFLLCYSVLKRVVAENWKSLLNLDDGKRKTHGGGVATSFYNANSSTHYDQIIAA